MAYDAMEMLTRLFAPAGRPSPACLPDDLRVEYEERAGIMEYHGGLPRWRAEMLALAEVRGAAAADRKRSEKP